MTTGPTIFYITLPGRSDTSAVLLNARRRAEAMKRAGAAVIHYPTGSWSMAEMLRLAARIPDGSVVCIRIDGNGILEPYTALRFVRNVRIMWEVHGVQDENFGVNYPLPDPLRRAYLRFRLNALSALVDSCVFVSQPLARFCASRMHIRRSAVIPNFILPNDYRHLPQPAPVLKRYGIPAGRPLIVWGGDASLRWHALDLIGNAAKILTRTDPRVLFVIAGADPWYRFPSLGTVRQIGSIPRRDFLTLVGYARAGIAPYHSPPYVPAYFSPLKILDYAALGTPVITTGNIAAVLRITDGKNGYVTDHSPMALARVVKTLIANPAKSAAIARRAKADVFSMGTVAPAADAYKAVLMKDVMRDT